MNCMKKASVLMLIPFLLAGNNTVADAEIHVPNKRIENILIDPIYQTRGTFKGSTQNGNILLSGSFLLSERTDFDTNATITGDGKLKGANLSIKDKNVYFSLGHKGFSGTFPPLLTDSYMLKTQIGLRNTTQDEDLLESSWHAILTAAYIDIPNMKTQWTYHTPLELLAIGWDLKRSQKIDFEKTRFSAWVSTKGGAYIPFPEETEDFQRLEAYVKKQSLPFDKTTMAMPFRNIEFSGGLDIFTEFFNLGYKGTYNQVNFTFPPIFNHSHTFTTTLHTDQTDMSYGFTINPKPSTNKAPTITDFKSEIQISINLPNEISLQGHVDLSHPQGRNTFVETAGINLVFSPNYQSNSSSNSPIEALSPTISLKPSYKSLEIIHDTWGATIEDVIPKITSNYNLIDYLRNFQWKDHEGTYSAKDVHEEKGYVACRDSSGELIPFFIENSLRGEAWGLDFWGPYVAHQTAIVKDGERYDVMEQSDRNSRASYYDTDARTEIEALMVVHPGFYITSRGEVTPPVAEIRNAVEEVVWN